MPLGRERNNRAHSGAVTQRPAVTWRSEMRLSDGWPALNDGPGS
jgi:hypothetical protein